MQVTLRQKRLGVVLERNTNLVVNLGSSQHNQGSVYYLKVFTDADLSVANLLVLNHNFGYHPRSCVIYDSKGELIYPDNQGNISVNVYFIDLTAYRPLQSSYEVILDG